MQPRDPLNTTVIFLFFKLFLELNICSLLSRLFISRKQRIIRYLGIFTEPVSIAINAQHQHNFREQSRKFSDNAARINIIAPIESHQIRTQVARAKYQQPSAIRHECYQRRKTKRNSSVYDEDQQ